MMNGKQLKNSILQLAIQGKLVPQNPADEPTSALLQRIRKEKEQLVNEKKLKKKDLVTTPISDEEKSFEIPESWEWVRFCEVFAVFNGDRGKNYPSKDKLHTDGIPFISALNLNNNTVIKDEKLLCLSEEQYDKLNGGKLEKGDNVICIRGSLGKHGVFPFERGAIASSLVIAKNLASSVIPGILDMYLDSPLFFDQIKLYNNGTAQPNLAAKSLENFLFPLPPLAEQHRIVEKIEELMPLVEEYDKAQTKLDDLNRKLPEALKKSILQEAIMGKLVAQDPNDEPASVLLQRIRAEKEQLVKDGKLKKKDLVTTPITDEEKPFEIPESWEWCRLGEIVVLLSGQDLTPNRYFDSEKGIPYITGASHFVNGSLKVSRWTDSPTSVSHLGDLLITCKGTVGTMAYNTIGDIHIARQIMAITPILAFLPYIQHYLGYIVPELEKQAHSIIPGISREVLLSSIIPLPPLSEQHRIVAKIEELFGVLG